MLVLFQYLDPSSITWIYPVGGNGQCFSATGYLVIQDFLFTALVIVYNLISSLRCQNGVEVERWLSFISIWMQIIFPKRLRVGHMVADGFQDCIALYTDCLSACNQNLLKLDWLRLLRWEAETRMLSIPKSCPLFTDSAFICRFLLIENTYFI